MSGMERIVSGKRSDRECIRYRWKVLSVVVFILFWWSANLYSLFESEWQKNRSALTMAQADISALRDADSSQALEIKSSLFWLKGGVVQDRFLINNIAGNFDLGLDLIFLPVFQEVQDNGVSSFSFPFGITVVTGARLFRNENFVLGMSGFVGLERAGDYTDLYPFGVQTRFLFQKSPFCGALLASYGSDEILDVETAFSWKIGRFLLMSAVDFQDSRFALKFASRFFLTPKIFLIGGVRHILFYESVNATLGLVWEDVRLLDTETDFQFTAGLNQLLQSDVGFDFTFHLERERRTSPQPAEKIPTWF